MSKLSHAIGSVQQFTNFLRNRTHMAGKLPVLSVAYKVKYGFIRLMFACLI